MLSRVLFNTLARRAVPVVQVSHRTFFDKLGYESSDLKVSGDKEGVALWEDQVGNDSLALKNNDQIEKYVMEICRDYFRTTKKASLELESSLYDHGLDSLDVIELIIQVEDDLGYVIDAENLERFSKPKHFVNFINQIEAYREEFGKLPLDDVHANLNVKAVKDSFPLK